MINILDLFSGTKSVRRALETTNIKFKYIGIDKINKPPYNLDLSKEGALEELIDILPDGFVPSLIWASPPCNKFSMAATGKGGNSNFKVQNNKLVVRLEFSNIKHNKINERPEKWKSYTLESRKALKMLQNTNKIIKHFKNSPYVIENPRSALSKYILLRDHTANFTNYCEYGNYSKKPTTLYTNKTVILNLKKCKHKKHNITIEQNINKYSERAKVPILLIVDVLKQLNKKGGHNENNLRHNKTKI